jgi:3-hydroxybutyryl-CoA dehydrogenase
LFELTILVDDLSSAVVGPQRFLNTHYLNPAGQVCAARPGFIVPRIQALAMNEAARLVEEGVASAADIDKAIKYGFGVRFAVLGLLEFIDWGGGDILYYASRYLTGALGSDRYAAPANRGAQHARRPYRTENR